MCLKHDEITVWLVINRINDGGILLCWALANNSSCLDLVTFKACCLSAWAHLSFLIFQLGISFSIASASFGQCWVLASQTNIFLSFGFTFDTLPCQEGKSCGATHGKLLAKAVNADFFPF